ncbi:MAG: DUF5916 domain-containing protein, partial [Chitinophagales bacterium]
NLPVASLDITFLPEYGKVPSKKTEVKVAYDNDAIYIGAMMYDDNPANIKTQLSERDGYSIADNFTVGFDTYDDDINGYRFIVSASGVQTDQRISLNSNNDASWDAVWQSDVQILDNGWSCEIKIPYSAIRFPSKEIQNWGMQFARSVNATGEFILWSPVDPNVYGIIPQWGSLTDLQNITPPLRLSFSPYLNTGYQWTPISDDPVTYDGESILNGGMDVKYGINESFTIDATVIPNFGEVQSDNVILNLSPFEQQFNERRPFFTEGTEIFNQMFNFLGYRMFYSRRIGGQPFLYYDVYDVIGADEEIVENPSEVSLYNATKFSGRTDKNFGIGILNAVAAEEYAIAKNLETGEEREILSNPLTNYNMIVFEQALKNNSKISFSNTNTLREGVYRDANVSEILYDITNEKKTWNFWGFGNLSQVYELEEETSEGGEKNLPTLGTSYAIGVSQFTGKWNFNISHELMTKTYDHSDMGIQYGNNFTNNFFGANYTNFNPDSNSVFSNYNGWGNINYRSQVDPMRYEEFSISLGGNGQLKKSFWNTGFNIFSKPFYYYDYYEPRFEGYKYHHAPFAFINFWGGTDYRKNFTANWNFSFGESPVPKDPYIGGGQYLNWLLNDKFSLSHSFGISKDHSNFGYVDYSYDAEENLTIYFGRRNITNIDNEIATKFIFGPKMNIIARARHYWGKVVYLEFYTLDTEGETTTTTDLDGNNYDINFNIFNVDFVYAWEFAPGSYLNLIWKDNIFQSDDLGEDQYFENLSKTFKTPQTNGLSLKIIYYLDYLYLKKV